VCVGIILTSLRSGLDDKREKKEERKRKMNKHNNSYNAGSELTIPGKDMPQSKRVSASHHFHRVFYSDFKSGGFKHQIRRGGISDDGCVLTLGTPGIKVANADDVKQTSTCLYLLVVLLFVDGNV
jgi:hypothetical protein